jgi:hypothetical protein
VRATLVAALVLVASCKDEAPSTPEPRSMPVAIHDAPAAPDAAIGPILDLVSCSPAPLMPVDPGSAKAGRSEHARVTLGKAKEAGLRGAGALLAKHENRLRFCYEQALTRLPTIAGTSKLSIIIKETGYPHEVIVDDSIDNELSLCLKHIVMELQFPKPAKAPVTVEQSVTFAWTPPPAPKTFAEPTAWTPYASTRTLAAIEVALPVALGLQNSMPTARLATCLGPQHTGSLRVVARVGADGNVASARAGGFGDGKAEDCIGKLLVGTGTGAPITEPIASGGSADARSTSAGSAEPIDIACDFVRGDPAPWRVAVDAYAPEATPLIVLEPAMTADAMKTALRTAASASAYVVALRDAADKPPLFLLAGRPHGYAADPSAPLLLDAREPLRMCGGLLTAPTSGPFTNAEQLLAGAARRCTRKPCPTLLTITTGRNADETATLVAAARRAGFERIRLGEGACPK